MTLELSKSEQACDQPVKNQTKNLSQRYATCYFSTKTKIQHFALFTYLLVLLCNQAINKLMNIICCNNYLLSLIIFIILIFGNISCHFIILSPRHTTPNSSQWDARGFPDDQMQCWSLNFVPTVRSDRVKGRTKTQWSTLQISVCLLLLFLSPTVVIRLLAVSLSGHGDGILLRTGRQLLFRIQ